MPRDDCRTAAAASALANVTDICAVFVRCPASLDLLRSRCPPATWHLSALQTRSIRSVYGAFREAHLNLAVPGSGGGDLVARQRKVPEHSATLFPPLPLSQVLPWAQLALPAACGSRVDLVMRWRRRRPLLGSLGHLVSHTDPGVCVRVLVYEATRTASETSTPRRPGARPVRASDVRDGLWSVDRFSLPAATNDAEDLDRVVQAHLAWATSQEGVADTTVLLDDTAAAESPAPDVFFAPERMRWCLARALTSHQFGAPAVKLPSGVTGLRLGRAAMRSATSAKTAEMAQQMRLAEPLAACGADRGRNWGSLSQVTLRALAILVARVDRLLRDVDDAGSVELRSSGPGPQMAGERPPPDGVPLGCLEHDFMLFNRELPVAAARDTRAACDPAAAAAAALAKVRLEAKLAALQGGRSAAGGAVCKGPPGRHMVLVRPHPSGFFSLLHGLLKPLMHTLRTGRVLLTPGVPEYTSAKAGCASRDLSCFVQPLSPACDPVAAQRWSNTSAERRRPPAARGYIERQSRAAEAVPADFASRGWFFWSSQLLRYVVRPSAGLARDVAAASDRLGLRRELEAARRSGRPVIGMHVRHGDACMEEEVVRARRSCSPLAEYVAAAKRVIGGGRAAVRPLVYLATDSVQVVRDTSSHPEFDWLWLSNERVERHDPSHGKPLLWDKRIWMRFYWKQTEWSQRVAWEATVDMLLLARCDAFVGKFSSNFFRAAYALRAAECDCAPPFASLDAPWCFDYGLRQGRNWEFPWINASQPRGRDDALFEC